MIPYPYIYANTATQTAPPPKPKRIRPILIRSESAIDDDVLAAICAGVTDWWGLIRAAKVTEDALGSSLRRLMLEQNMIGCRHVEGQMDRHGCPRREYYIKEMS